MAFPATNLGLMVELALGADLTASPSTWSWTDISRYVRYADGITITRGRQNEFSTAGPASAKLTLLNDGRFVVRNPTGAYYGSIARNTPLRVMIRPDVNTASDAFGRTTSNGWGTADSGQAWTVVGTASDYSTTSGVARATHTAAATRHYGVMLSGLTTFDVRVRVRTGALATGAALSAGVVFRYVDASNSLRYELLFNTDQTISVRAVLRSGGTDTAGASHVVSGITHAANTFYQVRAQSTAANAQSFRIKVWADGTTEPSTWSATSTVATTAVAGKMGLTSNRETGNTNANATVDFDDFSFTDGWFPRHTGYVDEWPTRWNDAGLKQMYAPITASGLTRRLGQGQTLSSAIRRGVLTAGVTPRAYWPCEDAAPATQLASGLPSGLPMVVAGAEGLGSGRADGSNSIVSVTNTGLLRGNVAPYVGTDWTVMWLINIPAAVASEQALMRWQTTGTYPTWQLVLTPAGGTDQISLRAYDQNLVERLGDVGTDFTGEPYATQLWIEVSAAQIGADISWAYTIWASPTGFGKTGTKTGTTAGTVSQVSFGNGAGANLLEGSSLGHISVWDTTAVSLGPSAYAGWAGETSVTRMRRLAAQEHIPVTVSTPATTDVATMGPPTSSTLLTQLREVETAEQGVLFDEVDGSIALLIRELRWNQAVSLALDVTQHQIGWPLEPDDNDQQTRNDITSARPSSTVGYRYVDTTSRNAVSAIGYYSTTRTVNLWLDQDLRQDAEFAVALGTVDDLRYPQVPLDLTRNPGLILSWLNTNIGNRAQVAHPPSTLTPNALDLIVEGWTERFDSRRWVAVLNTSQAAPWNAWILESGTGNQSRIDGEATTLAAAVSSGATSWPVSTQSGYPLWACPTPFPLGAAGEQVTLTAVATTFSDTFGRTTSNGWGTADTGQTWSTAGGSTSDYSTNGSVGIHNLSTTVTQRLSSQALGLGPVDVYADWIRLPTAPTGSGAVTLSLIACKPDANNYVALQMFFTVGGTVTIAVEQVSGGVVAAQDTTFPSVGSLLSTYSARLHITNTVIQGRMWPRGTTEPGTWTTSVATTSTPSAGDVAWRSERASTVSNAAPYNVELDGLSLPGVQTMTVTRAVNGVSKAQASGTQVSLWQPSGLAL